MRERVAHTIQIRKDKRKTSLAQRRQACLGATQQEESSTIRDLAQLAKALPGSAKELSFILRNPQVALNFVTQGGFIGLCNYFGDLDVLTCLAYVTYSDTCLDVLVKTNKQDLYVLGSKTALLVSTGKPITKPNLASSSLVETGGVSQANTMLPCVAAWILTNLAVSNYTKAMVSAIIQKVDVAPGLAWIVSSNSDLRVKYWCLTSILKLGDELDMAIMTNKIEARYANMSSVYDRLDANMVVPGLVGDLCSETLDGLAVCDILDLLNTLVSRAAFADRVSTEFGRRGLYELLHFTQSRDADTSNLALCLLARQNPKVVAHHVTPDAVTRIARLLNEQTDKTQIKLCVAALCMFSKCAFLPDTHCNILIQKAGISDLCEFGRCLLNTSFNTSFNNSCSNQTLKALVSKLIEKVDTQQAQAESKLVEVLCLFKRLIESNVLSKQTFETLGGLTLVELGMDDARPGVSQPCFCFFKELFDDQDDQDDQDENNTTFTDVAFQDTASSMFTNQASNSSNQASNQASDQTLGGISQPAPLSVMFSTSKALLS